MRAARGGIDVASAHRCRVGEGERADPPTDGCDFDDVTNTDRMMPSMDVCAQRREDDQHAPSSQARYQLPTPPSIDPREGSGHERCGWYRHSARPGAHAARSARRRRRGRSSSRAQRSTLRTPPEAPNLCRPARAGSERGAGAVRAQHHALAPWGGARLAAHAPAARAAAISPRWPRAIRLLPAAGPPSERMRAPRPRGRNTPHRASRRRLSSSARKSQRIRAKPTKTARKDSKPQTHPRRARGGKTKQNKNIVRKGASEPHPCAQSVRHQNEGSHVKLRWYMREPEP